MTDAVDKVGDEQRAGNNRIQVPSFLNQCCAPDSDLESMLLTRASKNVFRQHRTESDAVASCRVRPLWGDAVDKVGDGECVGNNRIQISGFLNRSCGRDSCLELILLTRASKNVYRQYRLIADVRALACLLGFTARCLSCTLLPLCFALAAGTLRRLSAPLPMS